MYHHPDFDNHGQVIFCHDKDVGLRVIIEPYKLIQQSEDAADILSGHNDDGRKAIRETLEQRSLFLYEILKPFAGNDLSEDELVAYCRTFVLSSSGLKSTVSNDDELQYCLVVLSGWLLGHFKR